MPADINEMSTRELLATFSRIMAELKQRGVVRTYNNPVADYCERLASFALGLQLENNSHKGYDAIDRAGMKYQIKGRLIHEPRSLYQLGVIRDLNASEFDFLIAVLLDPTFSVIEAYKIPHRVVAKYSRYNEYQHGNILRLSGRITEDPAIERIGKMLRVELPERNGIPESKID